METLRDAFDFRDFSKPEKVGFAIFTLFLLAFPWLGAGSFVKAVAIQFLLFSLFGMGWNTIGGYGGQVELGKAQYVGIGAYTVALTMVWWKIPFWVSMPIGILIALGSPDKKKHDTTASSEGVLSDQATFTEYPVEAVYYGVHTKKGADANAPRSMRVQYKMSFGEYISEWICFEHEGFARKKAESWWKLRSQEPAPLTAEEALR